MATKELKRAKAHKLLKNTDPTLNPMDYDVSLMHALNFFNVTYDNKTRRQWVQEHYPKVKFTDVPDYEFKTLGALCRLVDNGNELSDHHLIVKDKEFARLTAIKEKTVQQEIVLSAPKVSIQEKMDEKVSEFLAEFNGLVDQYTIDRTIPKVDLLIKSMGIRGPMIKKVVERVSRVIDELQIAIDGTDKQVNEGYSHFKKTELKKLYGIYESLTSSLQQAKVAAVRKPRAIKVKPPAVVAAKVKYQKENVDLKLTSVSPAQVVGATEVWVYNTQYRQLQYFEATSGDTLTFKGSTLQNFNIEKSTRKVVRKTEMLQALTGKRMYSKFFKEIKTTERPCTGRFSDTCIIMAAFK